MVLKGTWAAMADRQVDTAGRSSTWSAYRVARLRLGALASLAATLVLAGCRADSFSAPQSGPCTDQPGCVTGPSTPVSPVVLSSIDDARLRLVPQIGDAATQRTLTSALSALNAALADRRDADARIQLAYVYAEIAPFRSRTASGIPVDPPDVAALRLELIPAANTLGVRIE
jgi:hypothetical protein